MNKKILLYYKYVFIKTPNEIKKWQLELCEKLNLKGRIIIATEGINGTLDGTPENTQKYINAMNEHELFGNIDFKESDESLVTDKNMKRDDAIFNILREYIKDSKRIRFEGDGYGDAWEKEAKKRGLSNNKNTPEALKEKVSKKTIALYEGLNIMSKVEIEARYEIRVEEYALRIQIEGRVLGDIARNHVIPTAIKYQNILIENVQGLKDIYGKDFKKLSKEQMELIEQISEHIAKINRGITNMINERKKANKLASGEKLAAAYCNNVKPYFDEIRYHCDKLELLVDDELWPLTKYRELLFTK